MNTKHILIGIVLGFALVLALGIGKQSSIESEPASKATAVEVQSDEETAPNPPIVNTTPTAEVESSSLVVSHASTGEAADLHTGSLKTLLEESIAPADVRAPTSAELTNLARLFARTLEQTTISAELATQWNDAGWKLTYCQEDQSTVAISEQPEQRTGRGFYVVRLNSDSTAKSPLVLQAPHRFYDTDSGQIARRLFHEHSVRAVAWNTVHRRTVDLADQDQHCINAFTQAVVTHDSNARVVQLHGFGEKTQKQINGHAQTIISNGTRYPGRFAITAAANLKQSFGAEAVRLFPDEVQLMGGTQNRQGNLMRNLGSANFLHLEMDKTYREKLMSDAAARAVLFRSLTEVSKFQGQTTDR